MLYSFLFGLYIVSPTAYEGQKMKNPKGINMEEEVMYINIFYRCIYLAYVLFQDSWYHASLSVKCVEVIYTFYIYIFGLYFFSFTAITHENNHECHRKDRLFLNPYISNMYILDQNSRLPSHRIFDTYLVYISLLLVCAYLPLALKTGICWNLVESSKARIPLINLSHKWTIIIFIISNINLIIWICSQPTIYLNLQLNFYDVLTLEHTRFSLNYIYYELQ